jgi:transposase
MNPKLHAITSTSGHPIRFFITVGQVSDYAGAAALMNGLPEAKWFLPDRGCDADWFRETFTRTHNSLKQFRQIPVMEILSLLIQTGKSFPER